MAENAIPPRRIITDDTEAKEAAAALRIAGPLEKMFIPDLQNEIVRVLGELPVGPHSKARLLPLLRNLRKTKAISLTYT